MEINPFSVLEVTLGENSNAEDQRISASDEDPLGNKSGAEIQALALPIYGINPTSALDKVYQNCEKLSSESNDEIQFRFQVYKSPAAVLKQHLHCTVCDTHIGCHSSLILEDLTHPLLRVMSCNRCTLKYRYIDFPLTPLGQDVRCRWCSNSASELSPLRYCAKCPFAFCEKCITRNLPLEAQPGQFWTCCVCNIHCLWPLRAVLWGLITLILNSTNESYKWKGDISQCCKSNKKRVKKTFVLPSRASNALVVSNGTSDYLNAFNPSVPSLDKLIIETAWIKKKLYGISMVLAKLNEKVNSAASSMGSYGRADLIKHIVEEITTLVVTKSESLSTGSHALRSDFSRKLDEARMQTNERPSGNKMILPKRNFDNQQQLQLPSAGPLPQVQLGQSSTMSLVSVITPLTSNYVSITSSSNTIIPDRNPNPLAITSGQEEITVTRNTSILSESNALPSINPVVEAVNPLQTLKANKQEKTQRGKVRTTVKKKVSETKPKAKKSPVKPKKLPSKKPEKNPAKSSGTRKRSVPQKNNQQNDTKTSTHSTLLTEDITEFEGTPIKRCYIRLVDIKISQKNSKEEKEISPCKISNDCS